MLSKVSLLLIAVGLYSHALAYSHWYAYGGADEWHAHGCTRVLSSGQSMTGLWLLQSIPLSYVSTQSLIDYSLGHDLTLSCDGIPIMWQSSDLLTTTTTTSAISAIASTASKSSSPLPVPTLTSSPIAISNSTLIVTGLSVGAKAAIGVSIPLLLVACILGIVFYFRYRKQRELNANWTGPVNGEGPQPHNIDTSQAELAELNHSSADSPAMAELSSNSLTMSHSVSPKSPHLARRISGPLTSPSPSTFLAD